MTLVCVVVLMCVDACVCLIFQAFCFAWLMVKSDDVVYGKNGVKEPMDSRDHVSNLVFFVPYVSHHFSPSPTSHGKSWSPEEMVDLHRNVFGARIHTGCVNIRRVSCLNVHDYWLHDFRYTAVFIHYCT